MQRWWYEHDCQREGSAHSLQGSRRVENIVRFAELNPTRDVLLKFEHESAAYAQSYFRAMKRCKGIYECSEVRGQRQGARSWTIL